MTQDSYANCDIVIVNYNADKFLKDCVYSVLDCRLVRRIIIVDNDSSDGSLEHIETSVVDDRLLIIRNDNNLGFSGACNVGIRASDAEQILFLNPDCILESGALEKMAATLESNKTIGMVGGYLSNPDGSEQLGGRRVFPTPRRAFIRAFGLSWLGKIYPSLFSDFLMHHLSLPKAPEPVEAISGACMLVKRVALDDVGLWDEGYFLHCEDVDLCMRFSLKNWKVMFVPDAPVMHECGACSRRRPFFVEWHKHKGMLLFYRKFFRSQYPAILWVAVVAGVWLRFGLMSVYYSGKLLKDIYRDKRE